MNRYGKDFSKLPKAKDGKKPRNDKFRGNKGKFKRKELYNSQKKSWVLIDEEIKSLTSRHADFDSSKITKFSDLPLSKKTLEGLILNKYEKPTEIQRETIGLALQGKDILGAAKTGSGKTLAFLIPILEQLYCQKWSPLDGLGALIISPTRELAYQTFEVLRKIGKKHDFSAGLVIGGKHLREESERIARTNIIVCTPGRLLQHMDETIDFRAHSLKVLVLDEADRILDLGFAQTMNAVIENLPQDRQTLLFSATQTKSVKDLARLSLYQPVFVSVHELSEHSTPAQLEQSYIVCELHEKLNILWSFVKNHMKSKILVFFQSCKQVKFVYEVFKKLRTGLTTLCLHGGMHQLKRVAMYDQFCRKKHAVLFATDIAARGLDFPAVNWVIQLDCPEDANTYIHRAGRTARYEKDGESLLILLPSEEEEMVRQLENKKIPIQKIRPNPKRIWSVQNKLESLCASDVTLKDSAQRAFVSYLRSVFLMQNKKVFDVHKLDTEAFSRSLGLAIPPRVRFLQREQKRQHLLKPASAEDSKKSKSVDVTEDSQDILVAKMKSKMAESDSDSSGESYEDINELKRKLKRPVRDIDYTRTKAENADESEESEAVSGGSESDDSSESIESVLGKGTTSMVRKEKKSDQADTQLKFQVDDDNDDFLQIKKTDLSDSENDEEDHGEQKQSKKKVKPKPLTKTAVAKKILKKKLKVNSKIVFDEEGEVVSDVLKSGAVTKEMKAIEDEVVTEGGINIEAAKKLMKLQDQVDKQIFRERVKKMHREKRLKEKLKRREKEAEKRGVQVVLGGHDDDDGDDEPGREEPPPDDEAEHSDASFNSEEYDDFGGEDRRIEVSDDEDSGEEGRRGSSEDSRESEDNDDSDDDDDSNDDDSEDDIPQPKKRKLDNVGSKSQKAWKKLDKTGLSLGDEEELALKLLQS